MVEPKKTLDEPLARFKLEKRCDDNGQMLDTIVKYTLKEGEEEQEEKWCTIVELDQLFDACVKRWGSNWDLEKLKTAVVECEFD